jgi:hypothetical protein
MDFFAGLNTSLAELSLQALTANPPSAQADAFASAPDLPIPQYGGTTCYG